MKFKDLFEDEEPTERQKKAGNYKKKHITVHGLGISIENEKGSYRSGVSPDGKAWKTKLLDDYGYIRSSVGADKDHIDVFVGPNPDSELVFIVNQLKKDGSFDEHKVVMGVDSRDEAEKTYLRNYKKGWSLYSKKIHVLSIDEFKQWLKKGSQKDPFRRE